MRGGGRGSDDRLISCPDAVCDRSSHRLFDEEPCGIAKVSVCVHEAARSRKRLG